MFGFVGTIGYVWIAQSSLYDRVPTVHHSKLFYSMQFRILKQGVLPTDGTLYITISRYKQWGASVENVDQCFGVHAGKGAWDSSWAADVPYTAGCLCSRDDMVPPE